jgi:hypothetical protein
MENITSIHNLFINIFMNTIDLIQPRHSYAPHPSTGEKWHIYSNTSLWTFAAQLHNKKRTTLLHDENIKPATITSDLVWINLLWAPYIPKAQELIQRIKTEVSHEMKFILWWQLLKPSQNGLSDKQFTDLFWPWVYNGMHDHVLQKLDLLPELSAYTTSLIPIYEQLSDELFLSYFSQEASFFVAQWCAQNCSFCAADKWMREKYREHVLYYQDLQYLMSRLTHLGKTHLSLYMSNLDVFQTPKQLAIFVDILEQLHDEFPHFTLSVRWLAWVPYFIKLHQQHPNLLHRLRSIWFDTVGYGVDGVGKAVWQWIKKPQNNEKNILDTLRFTKEIYDITPELLMVFWHDGIDTEKTLSDAYEFTAHMVDKYGAIPRPHIAKSFIPRNDWRTESKYTPQVNELITHTYLFQALDFTALASDVTHQDEQTINLANKFYLDMCQLPWNSTQPILAYSRTDKEEDRAQKDIANLGKYDR